MLFQLSLRQPRLSLRPSKQAVKAQPKPKDPTPGTDFLMLCFPGLFHGDRRIEIEN